MSGRRGGNRIRGPQSALTDFLAANNISAAQIRDDYERRVQDAANDAQNAGEGSSAAAQQQEVDEADVAEAIAAADEAAAKTRKRKRSEKEAIEKIKGGKSKKSKKKHAPDSDDDFDLDIYQKAKPLPGQLEHCDSCGKRFTVTPYSKEGPDGGLLCTPCGKQLAKDAKALEKKDKKPVQRQKRRQVASATLDGVANRSKSLLQLCIEKAAKYHDDISELGDMPQTLLERLGQIFSKQRVMNPKTLNLFVRPDIDAVIIDDAAYLETDDYERIFATSTKAQKLLFRNCCQMKDRALEYMLEQCPDLKYLQMYAPNLVSHEMWRKVFKHYGPQLEAVKLQWIDVTFDDGDVEEMVQCCPNLKRFKVKICPKIGEGSIRALSNLKHLEHLSLQLKQNPCPESLIGLITSTGPGLRTLSLEDLIDLDDTVIAAIRTHCTMLSKLRIANNDTITDSAFAALFTGWNNSPLTFVDLNSTRDVDNNNPTGPEDEPIGLASNGFAALMKHSGQSLKHLDIASCRHISLSTFTDVFAGARSSSGDFSQPIYPELETINLSFCSCVDTRVIAAIFKACPKLKKLIAFGCFDVMDVVVPRGIALIGVPRAQDEIEQIGVGMDVDQAVGRMVAVGAA